MAVRFAAVHHADQVDSEGSNKFAPSTQLIRGPFCGTRDRWEDKEVRAMSKRKIVILNGAKNGDDYLASPFSVLNDIVDHDNDDVKCYHLKEIKLAHCIGCFGCWIKTPGVCVASDESREIIQSVIQSVMTILFTPVAFGGYS